MQSPLHKDLAELLDAVRGAERDLFGALDAEARDAARTIGEWSAKDVQGHLAAWRAIESRRLMHTARDDDPSRDEEDDVANQRLHAERAGRTWEQIAEEARASGEELNTAIARTSTDVLCDRDNDIAGLGVNAVNHAMAHLSDVARLAGAEPRYDALAHEVEAIARHNHLLPRDAGVLFYNIACHYALTGQADAARDSLRQAFRHRHDLATYAADDPDLVSLRGELADLASTA